MGEGQRRSLGRSFWVWEKVFCGLLVVVLYVVVSDEGEVGSGEFDGYV